MIDSVSSSSNNALYELYLERLRNQQTNTTSNNTNDSDFQTFWNSSQKDLTPSNQLLRALKSTSASSSSTEEETSDAASQTTTQGDISSIDADNDGTISEDEYETMIAQMGIPNAMSAEDFFAKYDTDNDGELTVSEMDASRPNDTWQKIAPPPVPETASEQSSTSSDTTTDSTSTKNSSSQTTASSTDTASSLDMDSILNAMDSNSDGVVSTSEFQSFLYSVRQAYESSFSYTSDNTAATYAANI